LHSGYFEEEGAHGDGEVADQADLHVSATDAPT